MLPIYIDNYEVKVFARKILTEIIKHYFDVHKDSGDNHSYLFPEVIYNEKKAMCDSAANSIELWSRDGFERDLPPLHEHVLFMILCWAKDMEKEYFKDTGESFYFEEVPNYGKLIPEEEEKSGYSISDINMNFYQYNCFQDNDFLEFHEYINLALEVSVSFVESKFHIDLNEYRDLMPKDVEKNLFEDDSQKNISDVNEFIQQTYKEANVVQENHIHISNSPVHGNINVGGDNVKQSNVVKKNEFSDKVFEELFEIINDSTDNPYEKQKTTYFVEELQSAIQSNNKPKATKLHNFILNSLGSSSALITIGEFISKIP